VTSVALLTAAALTSPDRNFVRHRSTEKDRAQMDYVHTNIVTALQNHLLKTVSSSVMAFAKGIKILKINLIQSSLPNWFTFLGTGRSVPN
jgi:hypothetical protein